MSQNDLVGADDGHEADVGILHHHAQDDDDHVGQHREHALGQAMEQVKATHAEGQRCQDTADLKTEGEQRGEKG